MQLGWELGVYNVRGRGQSFINSAGTQDYHTGLEGRRHVLDKLEYICF